MGLAAGCSSSATLVNHAAVRRAVRPTSATRWTSRTRREELHHHTDQGRRSRDEHQRESPPKGKRFIAAVFHITNTSSQTLSTDGDLDANLVGSTATIYLPTHRSLSECASHTPKVQLAEREVRHEL